ncbi:MAG: periplasmic heavy metal sensor, partial [Betaproteobacteria bacterium]|nr:periplasmic heavy metal sensor [Betaproteobacteria bacterium]
PFDPAKLDERLDRFLRHLYVEIDASDAQQAKLGPIVKEAVKELRPLREAMRAARKEAIDLLARETVDRAAMEQLRTAKMKAADQLSRRMTQALADAAEVLTPVQRKQIAERLARWRGRHG